MAKATIAIDPVTRIEGHLKAQVVVEKARLWTPTSPVGCSAVLNRF